MKTRNHAEHATDQKPLAARGTMPGPTDPATWPPGLFDQVTEIMGEMLLRDYEGFQRDRISVASPRGICQPGGAVKRKPSRKAQG